MRVKKVKKLWFLHLSGKDRQIFFSGMVWVNKLNTLSPTFSVPNYILASILLSQCCFSIKMETPPRGKLELGEEKINRLFTSQFNHIYTVNNNTHFSKCFFSPNASFNHHHDPETESIHYSHTRELSHKVIIHFVQGHISNKWQFEPEPYFAVWRLLDPIFLTYWPKQQVYALAIFF